MIGMSFFNLHLIFNFLYYYEAHEGPQQPTTANAGQRRSTQAHSGQRRPMQGPRQPTQANEGHSAAIDDRYVFSLIYILFFIFYITTKPTKAHSRQRWPTQANTGQRTQPRPPSDLHDHQRVTTTRWWSPWPPPALHCHQQIMTTFWGPPPPPPSP